MFTYTVKRILQMIPTLLGVLILVFTLIHSVPGDPAKMVAGVEASEQDVENIREELGLNDSIPTQFSNYVTGLLHGDLGTSIKTNRPVSEEILSRFPTTITLTVMAVILLTILGLFAGIFSATKPNSARDNSTMMVALFGVSMPVFWTGILLILLFAYYIPILPSGGNESFKNFILPAFSLALTSAAILARLSRSSLLEVVNEDYIRTARAKGVKENVVIYKHALKNALITVITVIGLEAGNLLGGAVLTETVFSMNGIGRFLIQSIQFRDYPAVQGTILVVALIFITINLVVDLLYSVIDPRIRY